MATVRSAASRAAAGSAAMGRPARPKSSTRRSASDPGGDANTRPSSARPSLMRHSGVLMVRTLASTRPRAPTRSASFQACSRWWPGYVSWHSVSSRRLTSMGRSVFTSTRDCRPPSYQLYAPQGWSVTSPTRRPSPVGRPNRSAGALPDERDDPVDDGAEPRRRHDEPGVPGRQPVRQGTVARNELGEARRGGRVHGIGPAGHAQVEARRDVVGVRAAGRRPGRGAAPRSPPAGRRASAGAPGRRPPRSPPVRAGRAASSARRATARSCSSSTLALRSAGPKYASTKPGTCWSMRRHRTM